MPLPQALTLGWEPVPSLHRSKVFYGGRGNMKAMILALAIALGLGAVFLTSATSVVYSQEEK